MAMITSEGGVDASHKDTSGVKLVADQFTRKGMEGWD